MPRGRQTAAVTKRDPLDEIRRMRARQAALRDELRAKRIALMGEVAEIDAVLAELGGAGEKAVAVLVPKPAHAAPTPAKSRPPRAPSSVPPAGADSTAAELNELMPWIGTLTGERRQAVELRARGMSTAAIAAKLGIDNKAAQNRLFQGRRQLREVRTSGAKPTETPASDDEPAPALAAAFADLHPDALPIARDLIQRRRPVNDVVPASIEVPKEEQSRAPTGWDRTDPDADFTDLGFTPKADPAFVHLWSPESGGTPACTLAHDAAARTTTDRDEATCATCLAIPEPAAPSGADPKPPEWVLGWMSPEIRRAYQGVALEGLSCQTIAWSESVTPNVISGRVNGARTKVRRLLRWEAEREAEGKPLSDGDRAPPPAYAVRPPDPLLEILNRPANNDSCSREDPRSAPDGSDRGGHPPDQDPPDVLLSSLRPAARSLTAKVNGHVRSRTISAARLSRAERRAAVDLDYPADIDRPRTRGDCQEMPRPCPWASCKHHLYLDVDADSGAMKLNFPHLEVWELPETCSLDVADRGGVTLEQVGAIVNLTRERIRQYEVRALDKMRDGTFEQAVDHRGSPLAEAISGE